VAFNIRIEGSHESTLFQVAKKVYLGDLAKLSSPSPSSKSIIAFGRPAENCEYVRVAGIVLAFLRVDTKRDAVSEVVHDDYPLSVLIDDGTSTAEVLVHADLRRRTRYLREGDMVDAVAKCYLKERTLLLLAHCLDKVDDPDFDSYRRVDISKVYADYYFASPLPSSTLKRLGQRPLSHFRPSSLPDMNERRIKWEEVREEGEREEKKREEEEAVKDMSAAVFGLISRSGGGGMTVAQLLGELGMSKALDVEAAIEELLFNGELYENNGRYICL